MFGWITKRLFSRQNISKILEDNQDLVTDYAKSTIHNVLEDEEVAEHLKQYGDALYNHYIRKFFGTLGGMQKGINYQMGEAVQEQPGLGGIFAGMDMEDFSLSDLIKNAAFQFLSGKFKAPAALTGQTTASTASGRRAMSQP